MNEPEKRAAEDVVKIIAEENERKVDKGIIKILEVILRHGQEKHGLHAYRGHSRKYYIGKAMGHLAENGNDSETKLHGDYHALANAYLVALKRFEEEK